MRPCTGQRDRAIPTFRNAQARRFLPATLAAGLSLLMVGGLGASAQEGTPAASPGTPVAAECTVAPRSEEDLRALFREVAATPLPASIEATPAPAAPDGAPADARTVAEINATWSEYMACIIAGDQARMFALVSDAMVRRQFTVNLAFGVTEEALFDYLAATPEPLPADASVPIDPITEALVLGDGRVAAVGPGDAGRGDVRIFIQDGDRWLLDDWYDLS